jgi:hypothetical protein
LTPVIILNSSPATCDRSLGRSVVGHGLGFLP